MTRALAIALLLSARVVAAQPAPSPSDQAAALYDEGKRHYDIAEYAAAIASWKQAYMLSSEPLLLFNIAQAYRLSGNCAEANRFYLNYTRLVPRPSNQAELSAAMAKCAGVAPATGETTDATPPEGGATTTTAPTTTGHPAAVRPPPGGVDETASGRGLRVAGYVVAGVGGISGVVAIVSALSARSKSDTVDGQAPGTVWTPGLETTQDNGQAADTRAKVFGGIAVGAVVTGGVLWWLGHRESTVQVGVAVAPQASEVTLSCAF